MFCGSGTKPGKFLDYLLDNNERGIEKLVFNYEDLLTHEYPDSNNIKKFNALILSCHDDRVKSSTVKKLIALGADCTKPTTNDNWEAVHYAAINADKDKLEVILDHLTTAEANSLVFCSKHVPTYYQFVPNEAVPKSYSNNALNVLLKYGNRAKDFRECCQILIDKGVNVLEADSNGVTPLELMKLEKQLMDVVPRTGSIPTKTTFDLIKSHRVDAFLALDLRKEEADDVDGPDEKWSSCTLLQLCCTKGLGSCVRHLLKCGADPTKRIQKNTKSPITIAIKKDHQDIVKLLLDNPGIRLPDDILIKLQTKYEDEQNFTKIDKYMEYFLQHLRKSGKEKLRSYLTATDELSCTPLHYAVQYRSSSNILELLALGAPLTKKDIFGFTPLHYIEPQVLEKFLDHCVNIPTEIESIDTVLYTLQNQKKQFSIEINYETLVAGTGSEIHESEFLRQLIRLKKLSHLLNHPVISSYLEVKWQKFKWAVYFNILLYSIAYVSLLFYGFAYNELTQVSNIFLLTSLALIVSRELFQLLLFRTDYIKRIDNLIDLVLVAGVIYILAAGWYKTLNNQNLRVAFSVVFLTSTLGIFLQLGNIPFFTIKVIILRHIAISFCKYMIFYIFPVLAFFFCFYMLQESTEDTFFQTLYDVTTMFAGDPSSDYPQQFTTNPIFSHIIYVCFIVLIGIILQNLLIGLAVSDLQEIRKEAEFIDKKERASYISNIERVLFSRHRESSHWLFVHIFRKLLELGNAFQNEYILVVQPYNYGCVYLKGYPEYKQYIQDQNIIDLLQNIFKDLAHTRKESDAQYTLKVVVEKLERIESMLERLNVNGLLNK